jgi:hypothetical protein
MRVAMWVRVPPARRPIFTMLYFIVICCAALQHVVICCNGVAQMRASPARRMIVALDGRSRSQLHELNELERYRSRFV